MLMKISHQSVWGDKDTVNQHVLQVRLHRPFNSGRKSPNWDLLMGDGAAVKQLFLFKKLTFIVVFFRLSDKFHWKVWPLENVPVVAGRREIYSSRQTALTFILPFSCFLEIFLNASPPYRRPRGVVWGTPTFDLSTLSAPSSPPVPMEKWMGRKERKAGCRHSGGGKKKNSRL